MSLTDRIEIEQIKKAAIRLETFGLHKSPVKNRGRKGIDTTKSNSKKRHYSRNITIQNNVNSPEWKLRIKKLQENARKKDQY